MGVERDADDFQVRFRLEEARIFYLEGVDIVGILDVLVNN